MPELIASAPPQIWSPPLLFVISPSRILKSIRQGFAGSNRCQKVNPGCNFVEKELFAKIDFLEGALPLKTGVLRSAGPPFTARVLAVSGRIFDGVG